MGLYNSSRTKLSPVVATPVLYPYSKEDLKYFESLILKKRLEASTEIEKLREHLGDERDQASSDSAYSYHMADAATDVNEREKVYLMIDRQQQLIRHLDRALDRIKNQTYGICRVTKQPIPRERLEAIPHTEVSVQAKLREKRLR
jgi:DnaK suppressor protein